MKCPRTEDRTCMPVFLLGSKPQRSVVRQEVKGLPVVSYLWLDLVCLFFVCLFSCAPSNPYSSSRGKHLFRAQHLSLVAWEGLDSPKDVPVLQKPSLNVGATGKANGASMASLQRENEHLPWIKRLGHPHTLIFKQP